MTCRSVLHTIVCSVVLFVAGSAHGQWIQPNGAGAYNTSFALVGNTLFAGLIGGISSSTDDGVTWKTRTNGLTTKFVRCMATDGAALYAGTLDGGVFRSTNKGTSWKPVNGPGLNTMTIDAIAITPTEVYVGGDYGDIHRTTDNGATWSDSKTGLNDNAVSQMVTVGSNLFASINPGGIMLSTDKGESWSWKNNGLTSLRMQTVAVMGTTLFAGSNNSLDTGGGIFVSHDNGESWSVVNNGLSSTNGLQCTNINRLYVVGSNVFVGTWGGIFLSTNNGNDWHAVDGDTTAITTGALIAVGPNLFAGSYSNGVWRRPLSEMVGSNAVAEKAASTQAISIYPNPATTSVTISFTPETSGYAEISILNLLGVEVAQIFSGVLDASEHTFTWEAQAKACVTGMYECIVRMNGRVQTQRIVITR